MNVKGVGWVGVKTSSHGDMARFFAEVMGLPVALERPDFVVFQLPDGDKLEVFGVAGPDPSQQFSENEVVAGFLVDDIEEASAELLAAGIELLGGLQHGMDGYAWQHFRGPDGKVFELTYDPDR